MALVKTAHCPKCLRDHCVVVSDFQYGLRNLSRTCGECVLKEEHAKMREASVAALDAAYNKYSTYGDTFVDQALNASMVGVLLQMVCKGDNDVETQRNLQKFWVRVREQIEKQ